MDNKKKVWFPIRRDGMGWGIPCCWQGWIVLVAYIASLMVIYQLTPHSQARFYILGATAILIAICIFRGGRRIDKKTKA